MQDGGSVTVNPTVEGAKPNLVRAQLWEYLHSEGIEITPEQHDRIRQYVKAACEAHSSMLSKQIEGMVVAGQRRKEAARRRHLDGRRSK